MTELVVGWTTGRRDSEAEAGSPRGAKGKLKLICCVTMLHMIQGPTSVTGINFKVPQMN